MASTVISGLAPTRAGSRRYALALLSVVVACFLSITLRPWLAPVPLVPFFAAVAISAWLGGVGPAVLSVVVALPAIELLALPPYGDWTVDPTHVTALGFFLALSAVLVGLSVSRDRAEAALRASEARFRSLVATAHEGAWLLDQDGQTRYANPRMAELLGVPLETIAHGSLFDAVLPDDAPTVRHHLAASLGGGPARFDAQFRRADGDAVVLSVSLGSAPDPSGDAPAALGLFTDITERTRRAQHAAFLSDLRDDMVRLADAEAMMALVADRVGHYLAVDRCQFVEYDVDADTLAVVHDWSATATQFSAIGVFRLSDYAPPDMIATLSRGRPVVIDDVRRDQRAKAVQDRLLAGDIAAFVTMPYLSEGAWRASIAVRQAEPRKWRPDELDLLRDVTSRVWPHIERARVEQELSASEARFRQLADAMPQIVFILSADARDVLFLNAQWARYTGQAERQASSEAMHAVLHPDDRPLMAARRAEAQVTGEPFEAELRLRGADGSDRWFLVRTVPIRDETGAIVQWFGTSTDIDTLKLLETERQAFLGAVAHDVKTPLTVIRGQTQLLQRRLRRQEPDNAEAFQGMLTAIERAALRATQMMESLVDVVQIGAGRRLDLKRESVDLVALAHDCVEAMRHGQSHPIRVEAAVSSLIGCWDRSRIERVLTNLLGNAIKFSPDRREIIVRVTQEIDDERAWAVMSVTDRGIGIPAADLPHIFERYRRGGNVTGQIAGSGIGLSAAQQIVAQHGGTIAVASIEGEGTTVTVQLPLDETPAEPASG